MKTIEEVYKWLNLLSKLHNEKQDGLIESAKIYIGSFEQIKWERDCAIAQLHELGYELGEKIRDEDRKQN